MEKSVSRRNSIICICLFVVIFGGLLALATVYDLPISKALVKLEPGQYYTADPFGSLFACIGSWPAYLFLSAAFAIIYANIRRSPNKALSIVGGIAANIASVAASVYIVFDTVRYITKHFGDQTVFHQLYIKIVFCFVFAAFAEYLCWFFNKLDPKTQGALLKFAFVTIFAVILSNILINIVIKNVMCRPRYRAMWYLGDYEFTNFHKWFQKSVMPEEGDPLYFGFVGATKVGHDAYRSFPSGHTNAAATVYALLCLPKLLTKYNTKFWKTCLVLVSVLVTGIVAVSRIVCGAHFFSDVLCGGTIMFLCVVLGMKIFIKSDFERA
ncbi:MAG: phosphatase PAP2 family protein [Clostridiaceae bacterium]|nr:phosphatase PAP2 family protein [Clostridiaceae bacterium]